MSEQVVKVEAGQVWHRTDHESSGDWEVIRRVGDLWECRNINEVGAWLLGSLECWQLKSTSMWQLISDAPPVETPQQLTPADLRAGMVFEWNGMECDLTGKCITLTEQFDLGGAGGLWHTKEAGSYSPGYLLANYRLISAPAEPVGFDACDWTIVVSRKAEPAKPRYAVGDRFVYGDGSMCEIVELNVCGELYDVRHTDDDEITVFDDSDFDALFEDGWLRHISGPTYRAPTTATQPSCDCGAHVAQTTHAVWCRTQGGEP